MTHRGPSSATSPIDAPATGSRRGPRTTAGRAAGWGLVAAAILLPLEACGQQRAYPEASHPYRVTTVVEGLRHPWGMAFLPDGSILVTERGGALRIVRDGVLDPEPVSGVPDGVHARGQGGLLDVAIHPAFEENRLVYLTYAKADRGGEATTALARGRLEGRRLADLQDIFVADAWARGGVHFGSRLVFDGDGYLYMTVGERGESREAQNLSNHQGTTLRLADDGSAPEDNPFVGRADALPEIFTWGNRSPQGLAIHPVTGELWQTEHGPRGGDELNRLRAGANYGWPTITWGIDYDGTPVSDLTHKPGMEQPFFYWVPSIATSGLAIYGGDAFPRWKGSAFVGGLAGAQLARVDMDGPGPPSVEVLLGGLGARIRDVREGPDGLLYVLVDAADGAMLRIEPGGGEPG